MKIGIAGAGLMGETHALNYQKIQDVKVFALAERNEERSEKFLKTFHPVKVYQDVFDMINDNEIDVIDICLPTPLHVPVTIASLNNNKHVLLEKPIALTIEDALKIKDAEEKSNAKLMIAHVLRFWPQYTVIQKYIQDELLEQGITEIYASRFNELPLWSEGTWIMEEEQSGGLIIDLMIHDIDFITWNLGKVNRVWCTGIHNSNNFAIQVMSVLEMANGAVAYVEGGYLHPSQAGLSSQMRVYTGNSLLEMYSHQNNIVLTRSNGPREELKVPSMDGYYEEIKYFIDCIRHDKEIRQVTTEDAIGSLKICLSLKESLKQGGEWVSIS